MFYDVALLHVQCARDKLILRERRHLDLRFLGNGLPYTWMSDCFLGDWRCERTFLSSASFFIRKAVALVFKTV